MAEVVSTLLAVVGVPRAILSKNKMVISPKSEKSNKGENYESLLGVYEGRNTI